MKPLQKIMPLGYLLVALSLMVILHYLFPLLTVIPAPLTRVGAAVVLCGLVILALPARSFTRAGTPLLPFKPATSLVTGGMYRFSRNPMYLGMVIVLAGVAILLGTLTPFLIIALFISVIQEVYIRHEEAFLESLFGETYRQYRARVRRWL